MARFGAQKRPAVTRLRDAATDELRELVRLVQDFGDCTRRLHRVVDLGFPEFKRYVKHLDSQLSTGLLKEYPTAKAFQKASVGAHHGPTTAARLIAELGDPADFATAAALAA